MSEAKIPELEEPEAPEASDPVGSEIHDEEIHTSEIGEAKNPIRLVTLAAEKLTPHSTDRPKPTKREKRGGSDSINQYLNEIGTVPLLNAQEERELAQLVEAGANARQLHDEGKAMTLGMRRAIRDGEAAKDRFIRANLRLVVSIAKRYPLPSSMELLDLIQEGNLGLEHAVDKFDWRKGFKFSTYATFWIRQAIGRALDGKASLVYIPHNKSASLRAALRAVAQSEDSEEVLPPEMERLYRLTTPTSLNKTITQGNAANSEKEAEELMPDDGISPEESVFEILDAELAHRLLESLEDRTRYAVELRFGLDGEGKRTFSEVGDELGITAEAARRLVERAKTSMRKHAQRNHLA